MKLSKYKIVRLKRRWTGLDKLRRGGHIPDALQRKHSTHVYWHRRLLNVLNSALFLWLLSALFITGAGSYFTSLNQCVTDADKTIDVLQQAAFELAMRRDRYIKCADRVTVDEITNCIKLATATRVLSKYKDSPMEEVYRDFDNSVEHVNFAADIAYCPRKATELSNMSLNDFTIDLYLFGESNTPLATNDIPLLREVAKKEESIGLFSIQIIRRSSLLRQCSVDVLVKRAFGYNPPYIRIASTKLSSFEPPKKVDCTHLDSN